MSGRVLIIEDDTRIADWVRVYLERAGFSAEVAHDGQTGLHLARDLTPDLIILDLMLPRLDGVELCRILRRESEVPLIMLTAREAPAERILGLDSGADDYIVKPFDPDEVVARAQAVLRRVRDRVQHVLTQGDITLNESTRSVTVGEEPVTIEPGADRPSIDLYAPSQPGAFPRATDLADLQPRVSWLRPRYRQPGRPPAKADQPGRSPADSDRLRCRLQVRSGRRMMSLRWKIMGAIVLVVVLTVLVSVGIGYYAAQARLGVFVEEIGDDEASQLARALTREYTASGGWGTLDRALSESGYIYAGVSQGERSEGEGGEHSESSHQDPVRVVITGSDGRVVRDNSSDLVSGAIAPELDGHSAPVFDQTTNQTVGNVYVDVNRELLSTESRGFLSALLYITLIGGSLTAGVAVLLAAWLARRITAPVSALTEATQAVAQGDSTRLPVTSTDELGLMSAAFNRMNSALGNPA